MTSLNLMCAHCSSETVHASRVFLDLEPFIVIEGDMGIFHTARVEARFLLLARVRSAQEIGNDAPENGSPVFPVFRENSGARSADKPHAGGPARGLFLLLTAPCEGSGHSRRGLFLRAVAARARPG